MEAKPGVIHVSGDWYDFKKELGPISDVELRAVLAIFKKHGFRAAIKKGAKDPNTDGWADADLFRLDDASDEALDMLGAYRRLKQSGGRDQGFISNVRLFKMEAWGQKHASAREDPAKVWARFKPEERLYMIIDLGLAKEDGTPTPQAISMGGHIRS